MNQYREELDRRRRADESARREVAAQTQVTTAKRHTALMVAAIITTLMALLVVAPMRFTALAGDEVDPVEAYLIDNVDEGIVSADNVIEAEAAAREQSSGLMLFAESISGVNIDRLEKTDKVFRTKFLLIDSEYAYDGMTIDDVFANDETTAAFIAQYENDLPLLDPGSESSYYVVMMDAAQFNGYGRVLDANFAKNNDRGERVDDIIYDAEKGIAYVPKSYYGVVPEAPAIEEEPQEEAIAEIVTEIPEEVAEAEAEEGEPQEEAEGSEAEEPEGTEQEVADGGTDPAAADDVPEEAPAQAEPDDQGEAPAQAEPDGQGEATAQPEPDSQVAQPEAQGDAAQPAEAPAITTDDADAEPTLVAEGTFVASVDAVDDDISEDDGEFVSDSDAVSRDITYIDENGNEVIDGVPEIVDADEDEPLDYEGADAEILAISGEGDLVVEYEDGDPELVVEGFDGGITEDQSIAEAEAISAELEQSKAEYEGAVPVQGQLLVAYDLLGNDENKVSLHIDIKSEIGDVATSGLSSITVDGFDTGLTIPVVSPDDAGKISLSNILVYEGGTDVPYSFDEGAISYDQTTGELTVGLSAFSATTIRIRIVPEDMLTSIIDAIANPVQADAATAAGMKAWPGGAFTNLDTDKFKAAISSKSTYDYSANQKVVNVDDYYCNTYTDFDRAGRAAKPYMYTGSCGENWTSEFITKTSNPNSDINWVWNNQKDYTAVFSFPGDTARPTKVTTKLGGMDFSGLTSLIGTSSNPTYCLMGAGTCCHIYNGGSFTTSMATSLMAVDGSIGWYQGGRWVTYAGTVRMRPLYINTSASEPYCIIAFCARSQYTQGACALYKFKIKPRNVPTKAYLVKTSSNAALTDANPGIYAKGCAKAVYGVYKTEAEAKSATNASRGKPVKVFTTKDNGQSDVVEIDPGTYWIKELVAPKGYTLDSKVYKQEVVKEKTNKFSAKDAPIVYNQIQGEKVSTNPKVTDADTKTYAKNFVGAEFGVYNTEAEAKAATNAKRGKPVGTLKIDGKNGNKTNILKVSGYNRSYYVKELVAPKGYKISTAVAKVDVKVNALATFKFKDAPDMPNYISVRKSSSMPGAKSAGSVAYAENMRGAVYGVYDTKQEADAAAQRLYDANPDANDPKNWKDVGSPVGYLTFDGKANTSSELVVQGKNRSYYVKELLAPQGYGYDTKTYEAKVKENTHVCVDSVDAPRTKTWVYMTKASTDAKTTDADPQGYAKEGQGAIYGIYATEDEAKAAKPLSGTVKFVTKGTESKSGPIDEYKSSTLSYEFTSADDVEKAGQYVALITPMSTANAKKLQSGALKAGNGSTSNIVRLDDEGDKTYYARELWAPKGFKINDRVLSFKTKTNEVVAFADADEPYYSSWVSVSKRSKDLGLVDGNPNYATNCEGAIYGIYDTKELADAATQSAPGKPVAKLTVGSDGKSDEHVFDDKEGSRYEGDYWLKELSAPQGYLLNPDSIKFTLKKGQHTVVEVEDAPITVSIEATKRDADTKAELKTGMFTFALLDSSHNEIDRKSTGNGSGKVRWDGLALGTYHVKEVAATYPYTIATTVQDVNLSVSRKVDVAELDIYDRQRNGKVVLTKADRADGAKLQGATYVIAAAQNVTAADGSIRYKKGDALTVTRRGDGLYAYSATSKDTEMATGPDGTLTVSGLYLNEGDTKFALTEVSTVDGHVLDATPIEVTVGKDEEADEPTATVDATNDVNDILIRKVSAVDGQPIEGVTIGAWPSAQDVVVEPKEGEKADAIAIRTQAGEDQRPVVVMRGDDGAEGRNAALAWDAEQSAWVANDLLAGGKEYHVQFGGKTVKVIRTSKGGGETHFGRYGDTDSKWFAVGWADQGALPKSDDAIITKVTISGHDYAWQTVTDAEGRIANSRIPFGAYTIAEIKGPADEGGRGYLVDPYAHHMDVKAAEGLIADTDADADRHAEGSGEYAKSKSFEFSDDITRLDISKREVTGGPEIVGATLTLTDDANNVIDEWVSADKPHRVEGLVPGTYWLIERMTPNDYDKAEAISFVLLPTNEVQHVEMFDAPISIDAQIDKRQEIAEPLNELHAENGDGKNRANVTESREGLYDYSVDFRSLSTTWTDEFTVEDPLDAVGDGLARLESITTPQAWQDYDGKMNVWYKTNKTPEDFVDETAWDEIGDIADGVEAEAEAVATGTTKRRMTANATFADGHVNAWLEDRDAMAKDDDGDYRIISYKGWKVWRHNASTLVAQDLNVSELNLADGEYVTAVRLEYGRVEVGFTTRPTEWDRSLLKDEHDDVDDVTPLSQRTFEASDAAAEATISSLDSIVATFTDKTAKEIEADLVRRTEEDEKAYQTLLEDVAAYNEKVATDESGLAKKFVDARVAPAYTGDDDAARRIVAARDAAKESVRQAAELADSAEGRIAIRRAADSMLADIKTMVDEDTYRTAADAVAALDAAYLVDDPEGWAAARNGVVDAAHKAIDEFADAGLAGRVHYAPLALHMRLTDAYVPGTKLDNSARVDAYRNGGDNDKEGTKKLEGHDTDEVTQTAKDRVIEIGTTLKTGDGDKEITWVTDDDPEGKAEVTLVDTVEYHGLTPGKEYVMSGELHLRSGVGGDHMDAGTLNVGGKPVTSAVTFTPTEADGTIDIPFSGLIVADFSSGAPTVAFEELRRSYHGQASDKVLAEHKDIADEGQTVKFSSQASAEVIWGKVGRPLAQTGDKVVAVSAGAIAVTSLAALAVWRRRNRA